MTFTYMYNNVYKLLKSYFHFCCRCYFYFTIKLKCLFSNKNIIISRIKIFIPVKYISMAILILIK